MNKDLEYEIDTIKGNINRLCVTEDKEELKIQLENIKDRAEKIYNIRKKELNKNEETN